MTQDYQGAGVVVTASTNALQVEENLELILDGGQTLGIGSRRQTWHRPERKGAIHE